MIVARFTVDLVPVAQPRHQDHVLTTKDDKVVRTKNGNVAITHFIPTQHPVHQFKYECKVRAQEAMAGRPPVSEEPIIFTAKFFMPRPAWVNATIGRGSNKVPKYRGTVRHITRPDLDNLLKSVKDALKGICWTDDSQVTEYGPGHGKFYHEAGGSPRVDILIETTTLEVEASEPVVMRFIYVPEYDAWQT